MERSRRLHVERTGNTLPGWDKQETTRPTAFMMITKFTAVMVLKVGPQRQLAQALSAVQPRYLAALGVPTACFTGARSGETRSRAAASPARRRPAAVWAWGGAGTRHGCGLSKGPQVSSVIICRLGDLACAGQQASPCEARSRETRTLGRQNKVRMGREQEVRGPSSLPCLRLALAGFKKGFAPPKGCGM